MRLNRLWVAALGFSAAMAASGVSSGYELRPPKAMVAQSDLPPASIPGLENDSAEGGDPAQLTVRIDRLEADLRRTTGQIEELQNQNRRLEEQLRKFREDVEFRLSGQTGAVPAPPPLPPPALAAAPDPALPKARKSDAFDPSQQPTAAGAPKPLGTALPSAPLGSVPPLRTAPGAPLDLASRPPAPAPATPVKTAETGPTVVSSGIDFADAPRTQLNEAIEAYKTGQYGAAEEQLKAFLAQNASHRLAPEAVFYLGETYLQRSRPREAAEQYLKISTDYSKSTRAPESMMRLGQSLAMLGNAEQACATFAEVGKRYPTASSSVKKTVEREMQKDHC